MRFSELQLIAFGHFTGQRLAFGPEPKRVHLVYGHNEAGKSTALRAVSALLFGVPITSHDTFLHSGPDIRIGAVLERPDGSRLRVVRRKGRKNTLLDAEGTPLDEESSLGPLLGSVDETLFKSMFGLDHETLRLGARELLSGRGRVSESLFGAGAAGHTHRLLVDLRDQAEALFTSRGRGRKRINQQIAEVRDAHKLVASQSTSAHSFQERKSELASVSSELERVKNERAKLAARKNLLTRGLGLLPLVARLRAIEAAREALGPLEDVPEGIDEWRSDALAALQEAEAQAAFSRAEIERHRTLIAALHVPDALVDLDAQGTESLSQRLGQHRKARLDLPKRQAELRAIQEDARRLLSDLGTDIELDAAEALRLSKPEEQRIRRQCADKVRLDAMLAERELSHRESQKLTAQRRRSLERHRESKDTTALGAALERARALLDGEERLESERLRLKGMERNLSARLSALGHVHRDGVVELDAPFPEAATLSRFERQLREADADIARATEAERTLTGQCIDTRRDLAELEGESLVPSEPELLELRARRDALISALRDAAESDALLGDFEQQLRSLELGVRQADQYGDRLRLDATRVAKKAQLDASRVSLDERLTQARSDLARARTRKDDIARDYEALWAPLYILPLPPEEMSDWLASVTSLSLLRQQMLEAQTELRGQEARLAALQKDLGEALERLGEPPRLLWESFPEYVRRAQTTFERFVAEARAKEEDMQRLVMAQEEEADQLRRLSELKEAQRQFRNDWAKTLRALDLDKDRTQDDVTSVLDQRNELLHRLREAADLDRRIQGILRDEKQLADDVSALIRRVLPELAGLPLDVAAERLLRAHKKATEDAREKLRLELELERHERDLRLATTRLEASHERIRELLRLARVETLDELVVLEKRLQQARLLDRQRSDVENEILGRGEGEPLATLLERASQLSAEHLREQLSQHEVDLGVLEDSLESLVQKRTRAEARLAELGQGAAEAAEELAQKTASLRASVRRYVRLRVASALLDQEIERYRDQNQGPVLRRSSDLFVRLTLGTYQGLKVGYDANDEPILLCVNRDGSEKRIEALSDGGRDQLYLSLRLATVLYLVERTHPTPLVLDDILIHFDDERARAALAVLGEVAAKTQVLFFTHHARLVELARQGIPEQHLEVCELGAAMA